MHGTFNNTEIRFGFLAIGTTRKQKQKKLICIMLFCIFVNTQVRLEAVFAYCHDQRFIIFYTHPDLHMVFYIA